MTDAVSMSPWLLAHAWGLLLLLSPTGAARTVWAGSGRALTMLWMRLVRVQTTGTLTKGMLSSTTWSSPMAST